MGKPTNHDTRMAEVYGHVYPDLYAFAPVQMSFAEATIKKNLAESGIAVEDLPKMNIVNVGTGRESVAFKRMGARRVFHRDVSPRGVAAIKELQASDPSYNVINTRQMDVCDGSDWGVDEPIDFIYLAGVLHHFHDAGNAIRQMRKFMKPGGKAFFRIYRSGSLAFYVVDCVRKIVRYDDRDLVTEAFRSKHPESHWQIYMGLYDDLFVPVLNLWDPRAIDDFCVRAGFKVTLQQPHVAYDHGNTQVTGQGVSLGYTWQGDGKVAFNDPFAPHIDQLEDLEYTEPHILKTNEMMREFIELAPTLDRRLVIDTVLALHERGQLYRYHRQVTSEETHAELQEVLSAVVEEKTLNPKLMNRSETDSLRWV